MLRPFFYFYGSKWTAAPVYPAPRYQRVIEPFAGSAGYSGLHHERDVVLVEHDPIIAGLWRWLIGATEAEVLALPLTSTPGTSGMTVVMNCLPNPKQPHAVGPARALILG